MVKLWSVLRILERALKKISQNRALPFFLFFQPTNIFSSDERKVLVSFFGRPTKIQDMKERNKPRLTMAAALKWNVLW